MRGQQSVQQFPFPERAVAEIENRLHGFLSLGVEAMIKDNYNMEFDILTLHLL